MDRRAVAQVCVDVVATGLLIAADQGIDYLEPVKRGFWCSDDSIAYPKQDETVPYQMLLQISMTLPVVFLVVSEILYAQISRRNKLFLTSQEFWYHLITVLFSWAFCFWLCKAITGFAKARVGRLRPVFLDYCKPNIDCSDPIYANKYITNFTCSIGHSTENFIRTSFPSGHSSESMVSMVFIIIYLWKRYCTDSARYFVALIQLVPLFIGLFVSLSRIYDNIHHWSDVLAGMALGSAVAFIGALLPGRLDRLQEDSDDNKVTTASSATFRSFA